VEDVLFKKKDCLNIKELNCTPSLRKYKQIVIFKKISLLKKQNYINLILIYLL